MQILLSASQNPYFNIACEEFLIKHMDEEIIFLYQNTPSVIVGKHQNAFSELNQTFVKEHGIQIVRRLSGGGSVFHDLGNLNFAHIKNVSGDNKVDFSAFLSPVIKALREKKIDVVMGPRNNLMIHGKKITGTACHTIKKRVMHHGTLLINANLNHLQEALTPVNSNFESKAVKSISSSVTNIFDEWTEVSTFGALTQHIYQYFIHHHKAEVLNLTEGQLKEIQILIESKYSTWEWNFGYSPKFVFKAAVPEMKEKLIIFVEKGIIAKIEAENTALILDDRFHDLIGKRFDVLEY